jgi:transposase-like protein
MEKRVSKTKRPRRHSADFKAAAVEKMKGCANVVALSRELKVPWRQLYRWKASEQAAEATQQQNAPEQREAVLREEISQLKVALADKAMEVDFFKGALRNIEALRQKPEGNGGEAFTTKSGK